MLNYLLLSYVYVLPLLDQPRVVCVCQLWHIIIHILYCIFVCVNITYVIFPFLLCMCVHYNYDNSHVILAII